MVYPRLEAFCFKLESTFSSDSKECSCVSGNNVGRNFELYVVALTVGVEPCLEEDCVCLQDGKAFGDEYLAELDLIEVVERHKEDYESDVEEPDRSCAGSSSLSDDDTRADKDSDR